MINKRKQNRFRKMLLVALPVAVLAVVAGLVWHHHETPKVSGPTTPISQLPASSSSPNQKKLSPTSTVNQGTATDNNGTVPVPVTSSPGQWTQSQSGLIVVQQPLSNATFKSGDTLSGTAKVDQVQYTLIDNQVGVISQGTINVVNGVYSATVHFTPYASTGRLDVFSTNTDGQENNEVQLPVNF